MSHRILIYEPSAELSQGLMQRLSKAGYECIWCNRGTDASDLLREARIDVAVVLASSGESDENSLDQIYQAAQNTSVLAITGAHDIEKRMHALKRGAADYMIWPFDVDELLARIETILRRSETTRGQFVRRGKILLDKQKGRIGNGLTWTVLSPTEHKVLSLLFERRDQPVSKKLLKDALADGGYITDNAVEVGICRLRSKARHWGMRIQTYRGFGYCLEDI